MSPIIISDSISFKNATPLSISQTNEALKLFSSGFEKAISLEEEFNSIFIDTNVLLYYYGMSKVEKAKLIEFFEVNQHRLILTSQVETEFLRNRLGTINKDLFNPINSLYTDYESAISVIKGKFKSYLDSKKKTFYNDYPEIWSRLLEKDEQLSALVGDSTLDEEIRKAVDDTTNAHKNIMVDDKLLEVCSGFRVLNPLQKEELEIVEKQYDELYEIYSKAKPNEQLKLVFPGSGDKTGKEYPYGDFIIYHEILKFMIENKSNAIFLTNEKSKHDWMKVDMSPNIHYVEKTFSITNNLLFILHAETPLNISFDNIHKAKAKNSAVTRESIVVNINKEKGFGFLFKAENNLYFNRKFMRNQAEFDEIEVNDCLSYTVGANDDGDEIAVNLERKNYSFTDPAAKIETGYIKTVSQTKKYGFIACDDELLYFYITSLIDKIYTEFLEEGVMMQFIRGKNNDGDDIVRLMRFAVSPGSE